MEIKQLYPYWDMFLDIISENEFERKYLLQILYKQNKKIVDFNKEIISDIGEQLFAGKEKDKFRKLIVRRMTETKIEAEEEAKKKEEVNEESFMQKFKSFFRRPDIEVPKNVDTLPIKIKPAKPGKKKQKKVKFHVYLKEDGRYYKNNEKLDKNFFNDLNYGDMIIQFNNEEENIQKLKKAKYISFQQAFHIFQDYINIICEVKQISRDYIQDEKRAFFNALSFFSTDFYAKDKKYPPNTNILVNEDDSMQDEPVDDFVDIVKDWAYETEEEFKTTLREKNIYKQKKLIEYLQHLLVIAKNEISEDIEVQFYEQILDEEKKYKGGYKITEKGSTIRSIKKDLKNNVKAEKLKQKLRALCLHMPKKEDIDIQYSKILVPHFNIIVRKIIILKLNRLGLWTRSFISSDLKHRFLVVKAQEAIIQERAEIEKMPKQFELGYIDLVSFDPLDKVNRPFRYKQPTFKEYEDLKKKQEEKVFDQYQSMAKVDFKSLKVMGGEPKAIFRAIKNLIDYTDYDFFNLINQKQLEFRNLIDPILKKTVNELNVNRLIDDRLIDRDTWMPYIIYILMFKYYLRGIKKLMRFEKFKNYQGFIYRMIASRAINSTNEAFKKFSIFKSYDLLETVWNKLGIRDSASPWAPFISNKNINKYWRTYEINELGNRDIFLQMERIKLIVNYVTKTIKLDALIKCGTMVNYFAPHDKFILHFNYKIPKFIEIVNIEKLLSKNDDYELRDINIFLEVMKDEAEESDFLEQSLRKDQPFILYKPWKVSIDSLRDYFGEKIALYFSLLSHYNYMKMLMGIFGIATYIIQQTFLGLLDTHTTTSDDNVLPADPGKDYESYYKITTLVFLTMVLIWSILFTEMWKRKQALFAMRYGMKELDLDDKDNLRPAFYGEHIRDSSNNDMNILYYPRIKRILTYCYTLSISFLIICASIAVTIALLIWKRSIGKDDLTMNLVVTLINTVQIIIFNFVYTTIAIIFTNHENHETDQNYINALVFKLFTFSFFNTFNSMFIIAFIKSSFEEQFGPCVSTGVSNLNNVDCFNELSYQVSFVFSINLVIKLIVRFLKPLALKKINKITKKSQKFKDNKWTEVDREIEYQAGKTRYFLTQRVDNTLFDIQDMILQYTFLTLFSMTFPLIFVIAFVGTSFTILADKIKLIFFFQRALPMNASSIGVWQDILEFVIYITIFINAAIFVFTLHGNLAFISESEIANFIVIIVVFILIKFIVQLTLADLPSNFYDIQRRHNYLKERILSKKFISTNLMTRAGVFMHLGNSAEEFLDV